jgi:hypothetical protein
MAAAEPVGPLLQLFELDSGVAAHAGVGGCSAKVSIDEGLYHKVAELAPHIGYVVRNSKAHCQCRRFIGCAHTGVAGDEGEALYTVALLKQHCAHSCAVYSAAHSNKYTFSFRHISAI